MRTFDLKLILAGGALALAFLGGVALAPGVVAPADAQLFFAGPANIFAGGMRGIDLHAAAASYIGITETALGTELAAGKSMAEVAVANGKTRDGLIAALMQAAGQQIGTLVDQKGTAIGPGHGRSDVRISPHVAGDPYVAAATYLGLTGEELRTRLATGQSLGAIANATAGKSRDALIAALVTDAQAKVDAAQQAGRISAEQATKIKADLTERITRVVDASGSFRGGPFGGRRGR